MSGPWSPGFSSGFGPLPAIQSMVLSNRNQDLMQVLSKTPTEVLYWDYSETQGFYLLQKPPIVPVNTLWAVSPKAASGHYPTGSVVYNPFLSNPYQGPLSNAI